MRAGKLRYWVTVLDAQGAVTGQAWADMQRLSSGAYQPPGLMDHEETRFTFRSGVSVWRGGFLRWQGELFLVDSAGPGGPRMQEIHVGSRRMLGQSGEYRRGADVYPVRVALVEDLAYTGEFGRVAESRFVAELLRIEVPITPRRGDLVVVGGVTHQVHGPVPGGDDGLILRLAVS